MSGNSLRQRLEQLLNESLESARDRQANTLERKLGGLEKPFVLFGAGHLGRKVLTVLHRMGLQPQAFIDNNPALWGTTINDVPVFSPVQLAESQAGDLPGVITTIWCGEASDRMVDRLAPLYELGFERFALFGHLAWRYPEDFLPHYSLDLPEKVLADAAHIRQAFELLSDEDSRELFVDHVEWRLSLDYDILPPASSTPIYFSDIYSLERDDEVVYDIGAFNGDSVQDYLKSGRAFQEIHSFEPSNDNYAALESTLATMQSSRDRLFAHQLAIGDSVGEILVEAQRGPASRVGSGSESVRMSTLDMLSTVIAAPTLIKIDIEGFEPQCLAGGRHVISEGHPVVAVCVYHEQDHLWRILLQLHSYYDQYNFSLCPHLAEGWDLVLYAVPGERVPA